MGARKTVALAAALVAAAGAGTEACSSASTVKPTADAATSDSDGAPGDLPGAEGGASDGSAGRPDGGVFDAGPCPGLTSCGGACVQTRTDMNNCGACGVVCAATAPSTASCVVGKCIVTLATSSTGDLAVQGASVYWANPTGGTISRVPIAGGTAETIVSGQTQPHSLAANATSIFWVNSGTNGIWKTSLDGGAPTQVTQYVSGQIMDLAIDATNAYYTTGYGYVMSVPLTGAAAAKQVTQTASADLSQRLAVDGSKVYFTEYSTTVYSAPIDGGVASTLATSTGIPQSGLAVTPSQVFWGTNSLTMFAPTFGGTAAIRANLPAYGLASDGVDVFGFTPTGSILKFPASGSRPETLSFRDTTNAYDIHDIAVDANAVYWTETVKSVGRVMKVSPK